VERGLRATRPGLRVRRAGLRDEPPAGASVLPAKAMAGATARDMRCLARARHFSLLLSKCVSSTVELRQGAEKELTRFGN